MNHVDRMIVRRHKLMCSLRLISPNRHVVIKFANGGIPLRKTFLFVKMYSPQQIKFVH